MSVSRSRYSLSPFAIRLYRASRSVAYLFRALAPPATYLYLTRIAWLALAVILLLPILACGGLRTLVLGAYDVKTFGEAALIGFTLVLAGGCLKRVKGLVDDFGVARFALPPRVASLNGWWRFFTCAAIVMNAGVVLRASNPNHFGWLLGGLLMGGVGAYLLGWLVQFVENRLSQIRWPWSISRFLNQRHITNLPGILITPKGGGQPIVAPGHLALIWSGMLLIAAFLLVPQRIIHPLSSVLLLITLLAMVLGWVAFIMDRHRVPVIICVVAYCTLMNLYLESDHYYRIWKPTPAEVKWPKPDEVVAESVRQNKPIVIVAAAGGGIQSAAWTTRVLEELGKQMVLQPADSSAPTTAPAGAAGTNLGILNISDFHNSVRLISGVSGGSVGAMQYAHAFDVAGENRFDGAARATSASSLQHAVLGLVRDDLLRATMPFQVWMRKTLFIDRGLLLQETWSRNAAAMTGKPLSESTLSQWAKDARQLQKPALIFNATVVETGERMAISTVPRASLGEGLRRVGNFEFTERYQADIEMLTAARLSATFPIVSPAARPALAANRTSSGELLPSKNGWSVFNDGGSLLHVVDGGYFDNSGVVGALEWLDEALEALGERNRPDIMPKNILIVELSAFERPAPTGAAVDAGQRPQGTMFDLISPALAIANVRNSGQASFTNQLLDTFSKKWLSAKQPVQIEHVTIYPEEEERPISTVPDSVAKIYSPAATAAKEQQSNWMNRFADWFFIKANLKYAPLSWHLRQGEIAQIDSMAKRAVEKMLNARKTMSVTEKITATSEQTVQKAEQIKGELDRKGTDYWRKQTGPTPPDNPYRRRTNKEFIRDFLQKK